MIIKIRNKIDLPFEIHHSINKTISGALSQVKTIGDKFIVNDSLWYAKNRKGTISPCVVNEAKFISKSFQDNLEKYEYWYGETKIDNQNIDGYGELYFDKSYDTYTLKEEYILPFLKEYIQINKYPKYLVSKYFSIFYGMYVERNIFTLDGIPANLYKYFTTNNTNERKMVRVGVEFETGNIASSFRAFNKLNSLFIKGKIDIGVFITSTNKQNSAARIWPTSNRNGSFEELEHRNYQDNIHLPIIEYGFEPDGFSKKAPYLKENKTLYIPQKTDKIKSYKEEKYQVYIGSNNDEILMKI